MWRDHERFLSSHERNGAAGVIKSYAIGGAIAASFYIEASETEVIDVFVLYAVDPPQFQELHLPIS